MTTEEYTLQEPGVEEYQFMGPGTPPAPEELGALLAQKKSVSQMQMLQVATRVKVASALTTLASTKSVQDGINTLLAPLNFVWIGSPNHDNGRALAIDCIVVHHCAGFGLPDAGFLDPNRKASSHVGIQDRIVHIYVANEHAAWTNGVWAVNQSSLTQELVNISGAPDWAISELTFDSSARLSAAWLIQYSLGQLTYNGSRDGSTLYRHCDVQPTACPGAWFIRNTARYIELVNKYVNQALHPAAPQPEKDGKGIMRIAGANRYETAAKVAECATDKSKIVLVSGDNYPDAASAGVLLAKGYPLLMCSKTTAPKCVLDFAAKYKGTVKEIIVIGGEVSVSASVATAVAKAAGLQ